MRGILSINQCLSLRSPFDALSAGNRLREYARLLSETGLSWWFEMEIPSLVVHLAPIESSLPGTRIPPRLKFLKEAAGPVIPTDRMEHWYRVFAESGDFEAASAAAGAGVASVWDSGSGFGRFPVWTNRIGKLLEGRDGISPLGRASLHGFRGLAELTGRGDLSRAERSYAAQQELAEETGSTSLRLFSAAARSYPLVWSGRIAEAQILLDGAAPLAALPDTSLVCGICFRIAHGSCRIASGNAPEGRQILAETVAHPLFEILPPSIWLLGKSHLLMAAAFEGDGEGAEGLYREILARAIPEGNHFHHGYSHFNLGIASIRLGRPHRALLHGRESAERGRKSGSPIPETISALVIGQALADLKREKEALDHLRGWGERWERAGFGLFASAAALEVSTLLSRMGKSEEARRSYEKAESLSPAGESPPGFFRPQESVSAIRRTLYPSHDGILLPPDPGTLPIFIETFGGLKVRMGGDLLYDREWRGRSTKKLLKALVAFGGMKVSADLLKDALWPDLDGDRAGGNLKVALSRLRRLGRAPEEQPPNWILVRHGKVSLARSLCAADSILFVEGIRASRNGDDGIDLLARALGLYKGDFLLHDLSEEWIVRQRERLREEFIRGAIALSKLCLSVGRHEEPLPFLRKALEKDPLHEGVYAALMRTHLTMGYPSKAIRLYRQARETLGRELGIEPGATLRSLFREAGGGK